MVCDGDPCGWGAGGGGGRRFQGDGQRVVGEIGEEERGGAIRGDGGVQDVAGFGGQLPGAGGGPALDGRGSEGEVVGVEGAGGDGDSEGGAVGGRVALEEVEGGSTSGGAGGCGLVRTLGSMGPESRLSSLPRNESPTAGWRSACGAGSS